MKNKLLNSSIGLVTCALLTSCSGGSNTGSVPLSASTVSAKFIDSVVSNLHYESLSNIGETDKDGLLMCELSEEVTFSIGALKLGSSICQRIITPQSISATITQTTIPQTSTSASGVVTSNGSTVVSTVTATVKPDAPEVLNRVRLLMTLDVNSDPSDGIQLPPLIEQQNINQARLDFSNTSSFDNDASLVVQAMTSVANRSLTSTVEANTHFADVLANEIPVSTTIPISNPTATPTTIGEYYDNNTGGFDEAALKIAHPEFDVPKSKNKNEKENEQEDDG